MRFSLKGMFVAVTVAAVWSMTAVWFHSLPAAMTMGPNPPNPIEHWVCSYLLLPSIGTVLLLCGVVFVVFMISLNYFLGRKSGR